MRRPPARLRRSRHAYETILSTLLPQLPASQRKRAELYDEPQVWSPEPGARSPQPQPSAYSVLSARIGSSAAARRAGSRAAAIATMARTMAAEA